MDRDSMEKPKRTLTDADIEAISAHLEKRFYYDLGKGLWGILWKVILGGMIIIASYGVTDFKPPWR